MPELLFEPGSEPWRANLHRLTQCEPDEAVASLASLVRAYPSRADALLALSLALTRAGRSQSAAEALRRARFLAPALASDFPALFDALPSEEVLGHALARLLGSPPSSQEPVVNGAYLPVRAEASEEGTEAGKGTEADIASWSHPDWLPAPDPGRRLDMLPDGLTVAKRSLNLWLRRAGKWAAPLAILNLGAALAHSGSSAVGQALPWTLAVAVGAPITLREMAREWQSNSMLSQWPRLSLGQFWAALLLVAAAFVGLLPSLTFKGFEETDSLALGMVVWLPLLGVLAPLLMMLAAGEGQGSATPGLLALLGRRGWLYVGLICVVGSVSGLVIGALGWGYLGVLGIEDELTRRVMLGMGASLPQSLVLALVAGCGMDALAISREAAEERSAFAYDW